MEDEARLLTNCTLKLPVFFRKYNYELGASIQSVWSLWFVLKKPYGCYAMSGIGWFQLTYN